MIIAAGNHAYNINLFPKCWNGFRNAKHLFALTTAMEKSKEAIAVMLLINSYLLISGFASIYMYSHNSIYLTFKRYPVLISGKTMTRWPVFGLKANSQ